MQVQDRYRTKIKMNLRLSWNVTCPTSVHLEGCKSRSAVYSIHVVYNGNGKCFLPRRKL